MYLFQYKAGNIKAYLLVENHECQVALHKILELGRSLEVMAPNSLPLLRIPASRLPDDWSRDFYVNSSNDQGLTSLFLCGMERVG